MKTNTVGVVHTNRDMFPVSVILEALLITMNPSDAATS